MKPVEIIRTRIMYAVAPSDGCVDDAVAFFREEMDAIRCCTLLNQWVDRGCEYAVDRARVQIDSCEDLEP